MELKNERKELFYKYDMDLTDAELKQLAKAGLERIKKDSNALANYAVVKILEDYILKTEKILGDKTTAKWKQK